MSVLEEVMLEEYERSIKIYRLLAEEIKMLPKGSIQKKRINNKNYNYLMYREGSKIKSKYITEEELEELNEKIQRRKENIIALKEIKKSLQQIEKALGKRFINEHTTETV